jgi:hypothetical protein
MPQKIAVSVIVDTVGWNFFDQFTQAMLVHGALAKHFPQLHARDETKWHTG